MKLVCWQLLLAVWVLFFALDANAQESPGLARQTGGAEPDSQFSALQAELSNLQNRLDQLENQPTYSTYSNGCGRPVGGWYGGFELVIVRPQFQSPADFFSTVGTSGADGGKDGGDGPRIGSDSGDTDAADGGGGKDGFDGGGDGGGDGDGKDGGFDGGVGIPSGVPTSLQPCFGFQATPRFYFGRRNDEGFGYRARYWGLDATSDPLLDTNLEKNQTLTQSLNLQAVDLELTQLNCLGRFELEFGGGVRYGHVNTKSTIDPDGSGFLSSQFVNNFDGFGPTAALNFRRAFGEDRWAFVGNVRGSILFGQTDYLNQFILDDGSTIKIASGKAKCDLMPVLETQFGIERSWWLGNGRFAVRGMLEGQFWGSAGGGVSNNPTFSLPSTSSNTVFRTDQDLGAIGTAISFMYEH